MGVLFLTALSRQGKEISCDICGGKLVTYGIVATCQCQHGVRNSALHVGFITCYLMCNLVSCRSCRQQLEAIA